MRPAGAAKRGHWIIALVASVVLHAALLVYVAFVVVQQHRTASELRQPGTATSAGSTGATSTADATPGGAAAPAGDGQLSDHLIRQLYVQEAGKAAGRSAEQNLRDAQHRARMLDQVPQENVQAMAQVVERIAGVTGSQGASKPRADIDPAQPFDHASASLYDIEKQSAGGSTHYIITLVDAQGQVLKTTVKELQKDEQAAFEVFELSRNNPKLRLLVDTARKIAESQMREQPASDANQ